MKISRGSRADRASAAEVGKTHIWPASRPSTSRPASAAETPEAQTARRWVWGGSSRASQGRGATVASRMTIRTPVGRDRPCQDTTAASWSDRPIPPTMPNRTGEAPVRVACISRQVGRA